MPTHAPATDRVALPPETPPEGGATRKECLDLAAISGGRFRVFMSEDHEEGHRRDPWNYELRGKYGKIWVYGVGELLAYTDSSRILTKLLAIGRPHQVGTGEGIVRFVPDLLGQVGDVLRLYRQRSLSEPAATAARKNLQAFRTNASATRAVD